MAAMEVAEEGHEKIFVSVRVRPLNDKEISNYDVSDWECINDTTIFYKNGNVSASERSMYPTAYTFDRVFGSGCSTRQVYELGAKEVALSAVRGINSSVFAYGQTSSGKTYTMTGITEYTIEDIYDYIQMHTERDFLLKFSAMEIYNESVRDLLSADMTPLRLLDDPERGTVVEKLIEETVRDRNHMNELLSICEAQRQIGETFLNETSSRSHQIIRLTIESSAREFLGKDNSSILTATVDFVDLAGSERASQSLSAGTRLKEGCHINRSLLTLGTVIRKLSKGRGGHVPYRDSKLTRILQPSLGGNARTAVICTMSPARIHSEQSRNTLLFASCAKEVSINAQVNVVMSDKALVKHLQRELARLESELRNPGHTSVTAEYATLLREKEIQIEKLEKDMRDLLLQRDIAQSQLKEVLQVFGVDGVSLVQEGLRHYPNLQTHDSPEVNGVACFSGHDRNDSEDQYLELPNFEENFPQNNSTPRPVITTSNFSDNGSVQEWDEMENQSSGRSEDLCKEVRCVEAEDCSSNVPIEPSYSYPDEDIGYPAHTVDGNEDNADEELVASMFKNDKELVPLKVNVDMELLSVALKEDREIASPALNGERNVESQFMEEEKELSCIHSVNVSYNEKSSSPQDLAKRFSSGRKSLTRSRSCKARLDTNLSSSCFEKVNSVPSGSDRDFIAEPEDLERRIFMSDFGPDVKIILSGKESHSSADSAVDIKHEIPNGKCSTVENVVAADACYSELKEKAKRQQEEDVTNSQRFELQLDKEVMHSPRFELQQDKEVTDSLENKNEHVILQPSRNAKDVGLDPIEDETKDLQNWPLDFQKRQEEIFELWDACHVSLVHRTYFYLLFQGDPTDSIYMEVELRRLSFLKDTFARGDKTVVRGQTLTLESSIKALRQERQKLSKQMLKKLTVRERESLYLKWGIGVDTRLRRLQLVHRLWTSRDNTSHINDSAFLVAKLVGFIEPGQAPKEMFSLDFAPRFKTGTFSLKRSLLSLWS